MGICQSSPVKGAEEVPNVDSPTLLNGPAPGDGKNAAPGLEVQEEPMYVQFARRASQVDCSKPRLLLVSDNLPLFEILIRAVKESTVIVPVQYSAWGLPDLIEGVRMRAGQPNHQFASVGLLDHGEPASFCLLKSIGNGWVDQKKISESSSLQDFFKFLASYVEVPADPTRFRENLAARVDLMNCSVYSGAGKDLVEYLENLTQVNWAASVNKTGHGYDWIMESDQGLGDVAACYFEEAALKRWKFTCKEESVNASDHMPPECKFQAAVLGYSNHIFFPDFAGNHVDPDIVISSTGYNTSGHNNDGCGVKDNFALLRLLRWARENGQYIYNPNAWNNMVVSKQITGKDNNWMYVMNSAVSRCKVMVQLLPFQDDGGDPKTVGLELEMARKHGKPVVFLQGTVARMLEKTWGSMAKVRMLTSKQHLGCIREYDYAFNMIGTVGGLECKSFVHASKSDPVVTQADVKEHYKLNITGSFLQWPKSPYFQNFDQSRQGMPYFPFYKGSIQTAEEDQYKYTMSMFPDFAVFQAHRKKSGLGTLKRVDVIPYDECHEAAKRLALIGTHSGPMREDGTIAESKGQAPNAKYHAIGS